MRDGLPIIFSEVYGDVSYPEEPVQVCRPSGEILTNVEPEFHCLEDPSGAAGSIRYPRVSDLI
jgi:hypothetical protein